MNFKSKTSLDNNYINMKIDYIFLPVTHIINLFISDGIFPTKMNIQ